MSRSAVERVKDYYEEKPFSASSSVGASVHIGISTEQKTVKYNPDWRKIGLHFFGTVSAIALVIKLKRNTSK